VRFVKVRASVATLILVSLAVSGGASAREVQRATVRPCAAIDLVGSVGFAGATGFAVGPLMFRNRSASACRLGGRPRVRLFVNGAVANPTQYPLTTRDSSSRPVRVLRPGRSAGVRLWWSNYCGRRDRVRVVVRVRLTSGARVRVKDSDPKETLPGCPVGRGKSGLGVGIFRPDPAS
jgi:Domain of unknown function (DUF4232)